MRGEISKEAFSAEGYITDQRKLVNVAYGKYTSDYNGCGWIAAYNLFRLCGIAAEPDEVRADLEKRLKFGGKFGTFPTELKRYLQKKLDVKMKIRSRKSVAKMCSGRGILLYWTGKSAHNAVFCRCEESEDKFRVLNVSEKADDERIEPAKFVREKIRFPLCIVFEVAEKVQNKRE